MVVVTIISLVLSTLIFTLAALRPLFNLTHNICLARSTKLPYYIFPVSEVNVLWLGLLETRTFQNLVKNWFPANLADYVYDSGFKFRWAVKDRLKRKYGGVYLIVTPGMVSCQVGDAGVIAQVCRLRQRFPKPSHQYKGMEIYGSNVLTSEEKEWTRHRRYTQSSFNEKNNALVWQESIRQTIEMLAHWVDQYSNPNNTSSDIIIPGLQDDITKITLNIFCGAGFGVHLPFKPSLESTTEMANVHDQFRDSATPPPGYDFTFRSVAEYIGSNLTSIFLVVGILPKWLSFILRPFFRTPLKAYHNLGRYLHALITMSQEGESDAHNLLTGLVRARREEQASVGIRLRYGAGLSDQEILGNLFMFTIAGHETSSTSLRFAFVLLAMRQDIQDWLYEDIKEAVADEPEDPAKWDYARVFPKLIAPLCVMLETLRLYPPVVTLPKWTSHTPAPITRASTTYTLPPNVPISLNANALHYSPEYWGPEVTTFSPSRWDKRNTASFLAKNDGVEGLSVAGLDFQTVHKPVRGAFIPFSDGSRACMGKKFAEVEFVAVLSVVFWRCRVSLAGGEGARERAEKALEESSAFLTLGMRDDVPLKFERRF